MSLFLFSYENAVRPSFFPNFFNRHNIIEKNSSSRCHGLLFLFLFKITQHIMHQNKISTFPHTKKACFLFHETFLLIPKNRAGVSGWFLSTSTHIIETFPRIVTDLIPYLCFGSRYQTDQITCSVSRTSKPFSKKFPAPQCVCKNQNVVLNSWSHRMWCSLQTNTSRSPPHVRKQEDVLSSGLLSVSRPSSTWSKAGPVYWTRVLLSDE